VKQLSALQKGILHHGIGHGRSEVIHHYHILNTGKRCVMVFKFLWQNFFLEKRAAFWGYVNQTDFLGVYATV